MAKEALKRSRNIKAQKENEKLCFPDDYWICAADLSLRRPGFCRLHVRRQNGEVVISDVALASVDNKKNKLKPRGMLLDEIFFALGSFAPHNDALPESLDPVFYVREKAINSRGAMSEIGVFEVVGIADFWAWQKKHSEWHEIYPVTVKRLITGDSKADKSKVAEYLKLYLGDIEFQNDDESDAAAVAVAFLIQNDELENKLAKDLTQ